MRQNSFFLFAIFFCVLIVPNCSYSIEKPTVDSLLQSKILSVSDSIIEVEMAVVINNPNRFKINLTGINSAFFFGDSLLGTTESTQRYELPARDTLHAVFVSKIQLPTFHAIYPQLMEADSSQIVIVGNYTAQKFLIEFERTDTSRFYFRFKEAFDAFVQESFSEGENMQVKKVFPKAIGPTQSVMNVEVEYRNDFPFSYSITQLNLDVVMENTTDTMSTVTLDEAVEIPANSTQLLKLSNQIDNASSLGGLGNIVLGGARYVWLTGTSTIKIYDYEFEFPVKQKQSIIPQSPFGP